MRTKVLLRLKLLLLTYHSLLGKMLINYLLFFCLDGIALIDNLIGHFCRKLLHVLIIRLRIFAQLTQKDIPLLFYLLLLHLE